MFEKKKSHFNKQDKHRPNARFSQTCIQHLAFDNLEAAYRQNVIFRFIWED